MKKKKKIQVIYKEDDGRTLYSMNPIEENRSDEKNALNLTKEEKKAIRKGVFRVMLPLLICVKISFGVVFLLLWLWLK